MSIANEIATVEPGTDLVALPFYEGGDDKQRAVAEWEKASKAEILVQLYKGAIVCTLDSHYGEGVRQEFARETGDSYSTIKDYASVYARISKLNPVDQSTLLNMLHRSHLTYTHVLRTTPVESNEQFMELMVQAHDENWSVARLSEERHQMLTSDKSMQQAVEQAPTAAETEEQAAEVVQGEWVHDESLNNSVAAAVSEGQTGRFLFINRGNDLELTEPWEALLDGESGEIVVYLENVKSVDALRELVDLANQNG